MTAKTAKPAVGIIAKPGKPEVTHVLGRLVQWLNAHGFDVVTDEECQPQASGCRSVHREKIPAESPTFVIVLGGDGTLLAAARALSAANIPILGVNLGSLGFLTEVALAEMYPTLEAIHENRCEIDCRAMLHCRVERGDKCVAQYDALNDVVAGKSAIARIAEFDVFVNREFVSNYKADGIIVATPTGSTAYSLAAGGPILSPSAASFVVTPVSPHALTNRALVLPDSAHIEITVKAEEETYLTLDGQIGIPLMEGDRIECEKSQRQVQLYRVGNRTFFDVLRQKLKWGER